MVYTNVDYEKMKFIAENAIKNCKSVTVDEAIENGFDYDALVSLYSQIYVRKLTDETKTKQFYENRWSIMKATRKRFLGGESLLDISKDYQYCIGMSRFACMYIQFVTENKKFQINTMLSNPDVIEDVRLRQDVISMIGNDVTSAHSLEMVKECLGREYEDLLCSLLKDRRMCFETETELRDRGKPKTPDFLFQVPMAINYNEHDYRRKNTYSLTTRNINNTPEFKTRIDSSSGRFSTDENNAERVVINWIDSKAMFADLQTFRDNRSQFKQYNNRYGRGLVIYWHGCTEEVYAELRGSNGSNGIDIGDNPDRDTVPSSPATLIDTMIGEGDDMIIVRECFPSDWYFPTGEKADGSVPSFDKGDV